jgi:hypothetical protein
MCLRGSDEGVLIDFVRDLLFKEHKALCAERTRDWTEKFGPLGISCMRFLMAIIPMILISRRLRIDR